MCLLAVYQAVGSAKLEVNHSASLLANTEWCYPHGGDCPSSRNAAVASFFVLGIHGIYAISPSLRELL